MNRFNCLIAVAAISLSMSTTASAAVDVFMEVNVPYYALQTGDTCFMKQTVLTYLGTAQRAMLRGSLAPTQMYMDGDAPRYVNVNLIATTPALVATHISDGKTADGIVEHAVNVDITALATRNGSSITGRAATIHAAKLLLLTLAENLSDISNDNYRLRVAFVGLPDQTGVAGTRLYATTSYPYSQGSPLLLAYRRELINVEGSCPTAFLGHGS